ncbi:4a-hydroxytetrahydrobiopterin dehydratase [Kordiimonas sp. SCSIO 12603]|uniref:4a-hydroxytetrahydrobiopterin dehydratase n=1 Tax=Kordiimonas sp. SCSIO 12603 TaxID=2829596 RepID=UPI0021063EA3|nr:4a-hydroxytetrahydrobiopterin dehydratase [Kordiimonas sp. SCSIO 12603]UTW58536.1 4a-hydroxytetrahydrobiopterin dehydratase [Kordiimonas sp. SCSIO 12603]
MSDRPSEMTEQDRSKALTGLSGWAYDADAKAINKTFQFADFSEAWAFMNRAALLAEKMDHHPEWFNVYNRVEVKMTTHDADGVTSLDIEMATAMEKFAA